MESSNDKKTSGNLFYTLWKAQSKKKIKGKTEFEVVSFFICIKLVNRFLPFLLWLGCSHKDALGYLAAHATAAVQAPSASYSLKANEKYGLTYTSNIKMSH